TAQQLTVGAIVLQRDVERFPAIAEPLPILREAIEQVGHPAIRNHGTVGGSIVHADPSAELPLLSIALDATVQLRSAKANRSVAARDFYQGYLLTDIAPDELLVGIDFRLPPADCGWCCSAIARRLGAFAIVAVAVVRGWDGARGVKFARIALGGVGPAPLRIEAAEAALLGERPGDEAFRRAAELAASAVNPPSDIHASSGYRRQLAGVLVRRALAVAAGRVKGSA